MESEVGSSRILLYPKSAPEGGLTYLKTAAGIIRTLNLLCGILSLILVLCGFPDDYNLSSYSSDYEHERQTIVPDRYERRRKPWLRMNADGSFAPFENYYGSGYSAEHPNVAQLICIVICLAISSFYLLLLVICPECHQGTKRRGWVCQEINVTHIFSKLICCDL